MAKIKDHYVCDYCGAICTGSSRKWKINFLTNKAVCPTCLNIEKQTKIVEDLAKQHDEEIKREKSRERSRAIANVISSVDGEVWKKILLWVFLWWFLIFYYPIKFIVVGIKDGETNKLILGCVLVAVLIVCIIVGSLLPNATKSGKYALQFAGLDDTITLAYGDEFDYTSGVNLTKSDKKVYGTITYNGSVDTNTLGEYEITYKGEYKDEVITKTVKIIVAPFYSDSSKNIEVLRRFKIEKRSYNTYVVSGVISNNSTTVYSKMTIKYFCVGNNTNYNLTFDAGLPIGDNDFSLVITTNESILRYEFRIDKIELTV